MLPRELERSVVFKAQEGSVKQALKLSWLKPIVPEPALLLTRGSERVVVVGDLHIGWEVALAGQGVHVPSQTRHMLSRLEKVVRGARATGLILLGDVKHSIARAQAEEWQDVPGFFGALLKTVKSIRVVVGNHDGSLQALLPSRVELVGSKGLALWGEFGLLHGHAWPSPELLGCETLIMGHLHPAISLSSGLGYGVVKPVWLTAACDGNLLLKGALKAAGEETDGGLRETLASKYHVGLRTRRCVFVPLFNDFLSGRPVNRTNSPPPKELGPLLRSGAIEMSTAEVSLLDGTYLGRVKQLRW